MRRDSPRYGNFPKRRKSRERPWNRASPAFGKLWEHVGKYRVDLIGIFDINPRLNGFAIQSIRVLMMDSLESFIQENQVDIAVLTVPEDWALDVGKYLEKIGIRAIWNFTPVDLNTVLHVCVRNVHLDESLMTLAYDYKVLLQKQG